MSYLSNYKKAGVVLLIVLLAVGMLATMSLAKNMGYQGSQYEFSKGKAKFGPGSGNGGYRQEAPDADGDGIPNGLDEDYVPDCDCPYCTADDDGDGIPNCQDEDYEGNCNCVGEPQGKQWGKK